MKILALISQKGGVGKTTLATALAVAAEQDGKNVALFDLDDQATAAFWGDIRVAETPPVRDVKLALLARDLEKARVAGADLVILDCPPVQAAAIDDGPGRLPETGEDGVSGMSVREACQRTTPPRRNVTMIWLP